MSGPAIAPGVATAGWTTEMPKAEGWYFKKPRLAVSEPWRWRVVRVCEFDGELVEWDKLGPAPLAASEWLGPFTADDVVRGIEARR